MPLSSRYTQLATVTITVIFITTFLHATFFPLFIHQILDNTLRQPSSSSANSLPYASNPKPRRLHHLLPVNRDRAGPEFCKTLLSSLVHGYSPIILNWEAQGTGSQMQSKKITGVHEFIRDNLTTADDNDLIFMMDAFDIWLQQSPTVLVRRYEELGEPVVIGADKACWPNDWDGPACQGVPESPIPKGTFGGGEHEDEGNGNWYTRPRWANSGTIIGSVASMRTLYEDLAEQVSGTSLLTDQGIFNDLLLEGRVAIDYWFRLFWADARDANSAIIMNTRYPLDDTHASPNSTIPYHLVPPLLYHSKTGEVPVSIHFNDHSYKDLMTKWWGLLWWNKPDKRFRQIVLDRLEGRTVTFAHNGSLAGWLDLCPKALLDVSIREDN